MNNEMLPERIASVKEALQRREREYVVLCQKESTPRQTHEFWARI